MKTDVINCGMVANPFFGNPEFDLNCATVFAIVSVVILKDIVIPHTHVNNKRTSSIASFFDVLYLLSLQHITLQVQYPLGKA